MAETELTCQELVEIVTDYLENKLPPEYQQRFMSQSTWSKRQGEAGAADFVFGNPHEMPLTGFVNALQRAVVPQDENWFAYKMSEHDSRKSVAESLRQWRGIPFESSDILMTN